MSEMHTAPSEEQQKVTEQTAEGDPTLKARTRMQELLRPPETTAEQIRSTVMQSAESLLDKHNRPEMQRALSAATGIFLWEQNVRDTGQSLPAGLTVRFDVAKGYNGHEQLYFDTNIITRDEYEYVIRHFKESGVID
jgi:hypothetical protein